MSRLVAGLIVGIMAVGSPAYAQDEIAALRAELARQQQVIADLTRRLDELETKQAATATKSEVEEQEKAHDEVVSSVRRDLLSRVNLSGYYNFRAFADGSENPASFQQHHLGLVLGKQLGRFSMLAELELQNIPHHAELTPETGTAMTTDVSGEGQVAVENAWMEYTHNRYLGVRFGKQLSPQYWWQNHYPNLTASTDQPIYLRELFPPELIGVMFQGGAAKPVGESELGVNYKLYVANNSFEGNARADFTDRKAWGARAQVRMPVRGALKKLDVAGDIYRGRAVLSDTVARDSLAGFDTQLEISRFLLQAEYARGRSLGLTRYGYYVQPAVRLQESWLAFYRVEGLDSPRIVAAEQRHLFGLNYSPYPQVSFKGEFYRSVPRRRWFTVGQEAREPYNGVAAAAVFFF